MPKTLYLIRHAESAEPSHHQRDFDRSLTSQGKHDAQTMGKRLKTQNIKPDIIISSPARRATQTSQLIATELGIPTQTIVFNETIYEASVNNLTQLIQNIDNHHDHAILVGHNPAIAWLISQLIDKRITNAPTSTVATLQISSAQWDSVHTCPAKLLNFDYPQK